MRRWNFSTDTVTQDARQEEWCAAMARLNMSVSNLPCANSFEGEICSVELSNGLRATRMTSLPQTLNGEFRKDRRSVWVSAIIDGTASFISGNDTFTLSAGDIYYGRAGRIAAKLEYHTPFSQISIKVPPSILDPRLINPVPATPGCIRVDTNTARIFSDMLISLAGAFEDMREADWRPIELSITQFLITSVFAGSDPNALWGKQAKQAAHLERICDTIETHLADTALSLSSIAQKEGVSMRYLQKLFASTNMTFSHYIRTRRLDLCRQDIMNAADDKSLSITEICFQRGFSCSAHFSRAFRKEYGLSPRAFRQSLKASLG